MSSKSSTIAPSLKSVKGLLSKQFPTVAERAKSEVWNDTSKALVVRDGVKGTKGSLIFLALPLKGHPEDDSYGIGFEDQTAKINEFFVIPPESNVKTVVNAFGKFVAEHSGDPIKRGGLRYTHDENGKPLKCDNCHAKVYYDAAEDEFFHVEDHEAMSTCGD